MAISSINPEMFEVNEYAEFNILYTITYEETSATPTINNITVTSPEEDFTSKVNILIHDGHSFTISGTLMDVFNREMHYIMPDKSFHVVHRWEDIPVEFETVFKYRGAQQSQTTLTVTVYTTEGDVSSNIAVNNNWMIANQKLKDYIALGVY